MAINSGFFDSIDKIFYPIDYCRWDDLGEGANHYHTITAQNGATADSNGTTFGESSTAYWKIAYTNSLKLHDRSAWSIEFGINILTSSTSTTNFQTSNEGWVLAQGEGDSSSSQNWAVFVDSNNKINFRYKTGAGANSFTSSGNELKLFNNQIEKIKITFDGTNIKIYKNDSLGVTHAIASAGILTDTADLVIGGNSTGNYQLLNTRITELRIRKDEFTGTTLDASDHLYLIEAAKATPSRTKSVSDKWDVNTLLYLPIASNTNMKPRQLRLIPNTWGDWTRWFVAPSINIDVTTGTINFETPTKGFKKITVTTTDGFLYPYNAGGSFVESLSPPSLPYWGGQDPALGQIHKQEGDVSFIQPLNYGTSYDTNADGQAEVTELSSTSFNIKVPSKGYLPDTEATESQALLDTTKVDATSGLAQYNQGFRPRGIKGILYQLSQEFMEEKLFNTADGDIHMMGMPYYDYTLPGSPGVTFRGGVYTSGNTASSSIPSYYDFDFRYNEAIAHIEVVGRDSTGQAEITTRDNHNLTTGDQVFVRPGQTISTSSHNDSKQHSLSDSRHYMALTGKKYVRVIGDKIVTLYHDSARNNPVMIDNGDVANRFRQGYLQKTTSYGNWIQQRNRRIANYGRPFTSKYSVSGNNNANVLDFTTNARDTQFSLGLVSMKTQARDTANPLLNLPNKTASLERGNLKYNMLISPSLKTTPAGTQTDPIIIKSESTGFTSGSVGEEGAPIYIDIDTRYTGTLKFAVSDVETADSSTPSNLNYQFVLNGIGATSAQSANTEANGWGSTSFDSNLTTNTASLGSTVSIPVTAATDQNQDPNNRVLFSIALKVWLPGVVHSSTSDKTRATYTIYYENNAQATADGAPVKLFYGSGMQPNTDRINTSATTFQFASADNIVGRNRHYIHYEVTESNSQPNPDVELVVKGIPYIGYSGMGDTVIVAGDQNVLNQSFEGTDQYKLPFIDETLSAVPSSGARTDAAPWLEQTTQTESQIRIHRGQRYQCQTTHTSGKVFENDFDKGLWSLL